MAVGIRHADHMATYIRKVGTLSKGGGSSVDIIRSRTLAMEFFFLIEEIH
jgi:hypothetical protein